MECLMPSWTPNWADVQFDHTAAQHYSATCRRTSRELRQISAQRIVLARAAVIEWEGPTRDRFDSEGAQWGNAAEDVAMRLEAIAAQVETAAISARHTQFEREQSRQRWWAEDAAERAAAAARAAQLAAQAHP
jgi:uncharacterized protein YukE